MKIKLLCMSSLYQAPKVFVNRFISAQDGRSFVNITTEYPLVAGQYYDLLIKGMMPSPDNRDSIQYVGDITEFFSTEALKPISMSDFFESTKEQNGRQEHAY